MMSELISVIVPVYKVEKYLDQCVESIVNQTYTNLEIILVDDGSPDQCGAMCDRWCKKDSRIRVIHKKNGGLSDARNAGLGVAIGAYVAFVDSDDVIAPDMLKKLLLAIRQKQAEIAECNYICFEYVIPAIKVGKGETVDYTPDEALDFLLSEDKFKYTVWNKLYQRKIFDTLRFEEGRIHEDVFFTYQAFGGSHKIVKVEEPLYYYRQRSGSIMGRKFSLRNLDSLEARRRQYWYIKKSYPQLAEKAQTHFLGNCLYFGQKALRSKDKNVQVEALKIIIPMFNEIFGCQEVHDSFKQRTWYRFATINFQACCGIRNYLKIGQ